jgi:hypothetical protein
MMAQVTLSLLLLVEFFRFCCGDSLSLNGVSQRNVSVDVPVDLIDNRLELFGLSLLLLEGRFGDEVPSG